MQIPRKSVKMATKMASEVHVNIVTGPSSTQVVMHNPGQSAPAVGAGVPATSVAKSVGIPNGAAHGQVPNSSIIFHNPS